MIREVVVLGAGSAGLLAALTLRRRLPHLAVRVIRSPEIGVIGVGEGTTPGFPQFLFDFLGLKRSQFFSQVAPIWKLGGRFLWGPREGFNYPFETTFERRMPDVAKVPMARPGDAAKSAGQFNVSEIEPHLPKRLNRLLAKLLCLCHPNDAAPFTFRPADEPHRGRMGRGAAPGSEGGGRLCP